MEFVLQSFGRFYVEDLFRCTLTFVVLLARADDGGDDDDDDGGDDDGSGGDGGGLLCFVLEDFNPSSLAERAGKGSYRVCDSASLGRLSECARE